MGRLSAIKVQLELEFGIDEYLQNLQAFYPKLVASGWAGLISGPDINMPYNVYYVFLYLGRYFLSAFYHLIPSCLLMLPKAVGCGHL